MTVRECVIRHAYGLEDYRAHIALAPGVSRLKEMAAAELAPLRGRRVWMVSSTAEGGGVAEMLPGLIGLLRELGLDIRWLVVAPENEGFFQTTKCLHNLLHDAESDAPQELLYEESSHLLASEMSAWIRSDDILIVHDPQPAGCGALLAQDTGCRAVWRCHIGYNETTARTEQAWGFLAPWLEPYARFVFSVSDYVPGPLVERSVIIPPALDPLSHKNRPLSVPKLAGILGAAGLASPRYVTVGSTFRAQATRARDDGTFTAASAFDDLGLLHRPIITQISRWDRLKGWDSLLEAFARLKRSRAVLRPAKTRAGSQLRQCIEEARLVLAGPGAGVVADDPESEKVLAELIGQWQSLPAEIRAQCAIVRLPNERKTNALIVNALQRCATLVVQNSRREGFGLTVTEAMWKSRPVLATRAAGIAAQIHDGREGRLVHDPDAPDEIAQMMAIMLAHPKECETFGLNAARRVANEFLLFSQAERWIHLLAGIH